MRIYCIFLAILHAGYAFLGILTSSRRRAPSLVIDANFDQRNAKVVNIDDIASLFGSSKSLNFEMPEGYEDDDIEDETSALSTIIKKENDPTDEPVNTFVIKNIELEPTPISDQSLKGVDDVDPDIDVDYIDLNKSLEKRVVVSIMDAMTLSDNSLIGDESEKAVRVFQYDPSELYKPDPMKYGAYRRWKEAEEAAKSGKKGGKKKAVTGKQLGSSKTNPKKGSFNTDSFYDAIKNLGSGPVPKGTTTGTGVMEPPPNKKPIQPQKGLTKRNKRKIITPDDINSLFSPPPSPRGADTKANDNSADDDDDDNDDSDDDDYEEGGTSNLGTIGGSGSAIADSQEPYFNPMVEANKPTPQWLADADKAAKDQRKALRRKKKKKLTDDWRFWAAIIATAGFASAFYSVFQQTGGFGTSIVGGGGGDELII